MANSFRIEQIYALLMKNTRVSVEELSQKFGVTPMTIRRDLLVLEEQGLIYRTRGYACILDSNRTDSLGIFEEEKKRIAAAALKFVKNNMSLVMDSGSTVYALCEALIQSPEVTILDIVTHSLKIAMRAGNIPGFNVSLPGGAVQGEDLVGVDVSEFYQNINTDIAFLGSTGVNNCRGLTVSYPLQLSVKQKASACASKRIALLDSSKFIKRGIYVFCDFKDLDTLITVETGDNEEQLDLISKQGVNIILV